MERKEYKRTHKVIPDWWEEKPASITKEIVEAAHVEAAEIDAYNTSIYDERKAAKSQMWQLIRVVWGNGMHADSARIAKYMNKFPVPKPPTSAVSQINAFVSRQKHLIKEQEKKRKATERKAQQEQDAKQRTYRVITLANKYAVDDPANVDAESVLDHLRKMSKYLDLAIAMSETRSDWNEGFYRVARALREFTCETEQDREIVADVQSCFEEQDGRVFRDTDWNYTRLYELVDADLLKDAQELLEYTWSVRW